MFMYVLTHLKGFVADFSNNTTK